jgi:hypothetical protein
MKRDVYTLAVFIFLGTGYIISAKVSERYLEIQKQEIIEGIIAGKAVIHSGQGTVIDERIQYTSPRGNHKHEIKFYFEDEHFRYDRKVIEGISSGKNSIIVKNDGDAKIMADLISSKGKYLFTFGLICSYDPNEFHQNHQRENFHQLQYFLWNHPLETVLRGEKLGTVKKGEKVEDIRFAVAKIRDEVLNGFKCKRVYSKKKNKGYTCLWISPELNYGLLKIEINYNSNKVQQTNFNYEKINDTWVMTEREFVSKNVKLTTIFSNWKVNVDIPDDKFHLEFPQNAKVSDQRGKMI